jgi:RNA polymerase sigma factor (sigma-70 family)
MDFAEMRLSRDQGSRSLGTGGSFHRLLLPVVDAALRRVVTAGDPEYEDLLQSALEAVLAAIGKDRFRGDASLSTWASTIARNVAIDVLRARSRERRVFAHDAGTEELAAQSQATGPSPERLADVRQQLTQYHDALWRLSPAKAQVVYLYDVLGHRLEEIASVIGSSIAATQSRLVRGRKEIGDILASLERKGGDLARGEEPVPRSSVRWSTSPTGTNVDGEPQSCIESDPCPPESVVPALTRSRVG